MVETADIALTHAYIQPNSPMHFARLVFDLDWHKPNHRFESLPIRYLAQASAWTNDLGLPPPNWVALSRDKNSAHIGYELTTPVARHESARAHPLRYLAAIEDAYSLRLGADIGFSGTLCKNPLHENWDFYSGTHLPYDLHDLSEHVELSNAHRHKYNRTPRGEVGRNVYLFDCIRFWAYDHIEQLRCLGFEKWKQQVLNAALTLNSAGYAHLANLSKAELLPLSECRALAKSVATWTWSNHGKRALTDSFSELQAYRGKIGAACSAEAKRLKREEQIRAAIKELNSLGEKPTMGKVASLAGCSRQTLSQHYRQYF